MKSTRVIYRNSALVCLLVFILLGLQSHVLQSSVAHSVSESSTTTPGASAVIREIKLNSNDLAYDPVGQKFYASVPSNFGETGNSVMQIDPTTLTVGSPIRVGSEPGRMALSDDGQFLYVALTGAAAIKRINLITQSADQHFWPGNQVSSGDIIPTIEAPYAARDLITLSGQNSLAVVRYRTALSGSNGVAIYQDGNKLPNDSGNIDLASTYRITRGGSPNVLYGIGMNGGDFLTFDVNQNGVSLVRNTRGFDLINAGSGNEIYFGGGFIYTKNKLKIDPETPKIVGTFSVPFPDQVQGIVPDPQSGRLYVLGNSDCGSSCGFSVNILAYDLNTLSFIGSIVVPGVKGTVKRLVRWGANGLAFNTAEQTFVIRTSLVPSSDPLDLPPVTQPTRTIPPDIVGTVRQLSLPNTDLIYDSQRQLIYASVPGFAGSNGNSIVPIEPVAGTLGTARGIGVNPGKLAISKNNQYLYAACIGEEVVRRLNLDSNLVDGEFRISHGQGATFAYDMAVFPDDPTSVVVGTSVSLGGGAKSNLIYKNGFVFLPRFGDGHTAIETSDEPSVFYGADQQSVGGSLYTKYKFGEPGLRSDNISPQGVVLNFIGGFNIDIKWDGGLLYDGLGRVEDPHKIVLLGTFDLTGSQSRSLVVPDSKAGRVYFLSGLVSSTGSTWTLRAFDSQTFLPVGKIDIPGVIGPAGSLIRWGSDGIAFGTGGNQVFLIQSSAFDVTAPPSPTPTPTPSFVQFASTQVNANESNNSVNVTITRSGDISGTATVSYTSSDSSGSQNCNVVNGSASARCDYISALGTLSFASNEVSKTVSVPIVDDVRAEGTETFSITMANIAGASLSGPATANISITDNESANGNTNPIDDAAVFVRQNYIDFLGREPDPPGLTFWTNEITSCGSDQSCVEVKRINVSAAFFLSIEFQETGYLLYRIHKAAFGNRTETPIPVDFDLFMRDTQKLRKGIQVGVGDWQSRLEINKREFFLEFVQRPEFINAYPASMTGDQYVAKMNNNIGGVMTAAEQAGATSKLTAVPYDITRRIEVLRAISDNAVLKTSESNKAFVLMQYFGYLRRDPDVSPDSDFAGYLFWLSKLDHFGGNYVTAEMVKAFISSIEYRQRFAP